MILASLLVIVYLATAAVVVCVVDPDDGGDLVFVSVVALIWPLWVPFWVFGRLSLALLGRLIWEIRF